MEFGKSLIKITKETADLITYTAEILDGKLHFFVQCNVALKIFKFSVFSNKQTLLTEQLAQKCPLRSGIFG